MTEPLKLLSTTVVEQLATDVEKNLDRYLSGGFTDLAKGNGWAIETSIAQWDPAIVARLDPAGTPDAEVNNSLIVYRGLKSMTPALAREERLWTRLCHIECLSYVRERWLREGDRLASQVRSHFFASGLPGCRDDNAIGRLWWNGHIASLACPDNVELGLQLLLARANIRLQIVDRADTAFRQPLIGGIFRLLEVDPWFACDDAAIADFMYEVNKRSGGIIFEALTDERIDEHLEYCLNLAKARRAPLAEAAA